VNVTEERIGQVLPTATGFGARLTIAVLKKHNLAPGPILGRAGVSEQDFASRQRRISAASESKCLEYAAEAMDDSAFGLHLAEEANPRDAGLPFYIASAANNLGEALELFARYSRIVNEAMRIKLVRSPEGVVAEVTFVDHSRQRAKQVTEFAIAIILKGVREVVGRNIRPMHVSFAHGRNSDLRDFERFFRCAVEFGASRDQLAFSYETLGLPLVTEDRHLLETLQPICDEAAKERSTVSGTLRAAVENEAQKLLPHGKARRHSVAKALGLSARTLTRKLADEGTTYEQVVDELRQSLARQYIREQAVSLSQIAWLLGYERSTSFNHAFRRWTGGSPSLARNEKFLAASV
jgi:AraC-like DNA-binding protein